ncbi:multiple C2 and transmembrane domain-containing protein-like [Diabrotica undecimpunctata]|uniref:multiple C2 and transmembrane domain-containing protein-like n=2 Tax=Diabrotica undecimpunctata TaxID=50387 RepID=UPI003B63B324
MAGVLKSPHTNLNDLWSNDSTAPELFKMVMPLKRFSLLLRALCFDNIHTRAQRKLIDKLAPIRNIFQKLIERSQACYMPGRNLTCDNWFTLVPSAKELKKKKITLVGTIRKNKREIPEIFVAAKKKPICSSLFAFGRECLLVSYVPKTNKNVLLLSTLQEYDEINEESGEACKLVVVTFYNQTKSGVDSVDQLKSLYSVARITRKIAIPLLRIRNGEKTWFALKDKKLRTRAKGNEPQIILEMIIQRNPMRACIRTLNPREEKYMQTEVKFKRQVFVKNVLRLKVFVMYFLEVGKLFQNCFEWESKLQSFAALVVWVILCYYFQPWMFPILVLLVFLKQYIVRSLLGPLQVPWDESQDSEGEDDDEEDKEKEEKKSLKERLQAIEEVTQGVQNAIGWIASLLEGIKNMFNFTVPYLSCIAIFLLVVATVVLYILSIRYLLMLWGINKFLRRILRPHSVPNNEILDLLSRIPDDEMLTYIKLLGSGLSTHLGRLTVIRWYLQLDYKDLKLLMNNEPADRRREPKKKQKTS